MADDQVVDCCALKKTILQLFEGVDPAERNQALVCTTAELMLSLVEAGDAETLGLTFQQYVGHLQITVSSYMSERWPDADTAPPSES